MQAMRIPSFPMLLNEAGFPMIDNSKINYHEKKQRLSNFWR